MEIKKREVLCSIILAMMLLAVGIFISDKIFQHTNNTAEQYASATIIDDPEQFRYGMKTNFGKSLLYGELYTNSPVTFPEIGGEYLEISKVREEYTRHTRIVTRTDSDGHTHSETEVYWTWDYAGEEIRRADSVVFLTETFTGDLIPLPSQTLSLAGIDAHGKSGNYIYEWGDVRYYYIGTKNHVWGTVFANLLNNTIENTSELYLDMMPEAVIEE